MPELHSMSDEEFLKLDLESLASEDDASDESNDITEDHQEMPDDTSDQDDEDVVEDEDYEETEDDDSEVNVFEEGDTTNDDDHVDETNQSEPTDTDGQETESKDTQDYKAFFDEVTKSFKANGTMMTVTDPADIIALMQQGANYSKKMGELKPKMAILKALEENNLLDNAKISHLIDIYNKDPKAIKKLIQDSGLDTYELDSEDNDGYVPENKVKEITELQTVLDELNSDSNFQEVLNDIVNTWDNESKDFVAQRPGVLRVLLEQRNSGIYHKVKGIVEYERMLGRMKDIPYVEAYTIIEQQLSGEDSNPEPQPQRTKAAFKGTRPTKKSQSNAKRSKAAAPNSGGNAEQDIDTATLSDAEFLKLMAAH